MRFHLESGQSTVEAVRFVLCVPSDWKKIPSRRKLMDRFIEWMSSITTNIANEMHWHCKPAMSWRWNLMRTVSCCLQGSDRFDLSPAHTKGSSGRKKKISDNLPTIRLVHVIILTTDVGPVATSQHFLVGFLPLYFMSGAYKPFFFALCTHTPARCEKWNSCLVSLGEATCSTFCHSRSCGTRTPPKMHYKACGKAICFDLFSCVCSSVVSF